MDTDQPAQGATQEQDQRVDALAIVPVGYGAQHVTGSQVPFPDGADHGWVVTIGGAIAYVDEDTMDRQARMVLFGDQA